MSSKHRLSVEQKFERVKLFWIQVVEGDGQIGAAIVSGFSWVNAALPKPGPSFVFILD
jgi:hypothetical protein